MDHYIDKINDLLPPDVFDIIFHILRSEEPDKKGLFQASLVCRTWRHHTLRHRFHSLSLTLTAPSDWDTGPDEDSYSARDFQKTQLFLAVQHYVQVLQLTANPPFLSPDFAHVARFFPSLHSLTLIGILTSPSSPLEALYPVHLDNLTISGSLSAYTMKARPGHDSRGLSAVLSQFSSIKHLKLVDLYSLNEDDEPSGSDNALPSLSSLTLRQTPLEGPMADIIERMVTPGRLRHLDLTAFSTNEPDEALVLAHRRHFAEPIEHLKVSVTCWGSHDADEVSSYTYLSCLPNLKRLALAIELELVDGVVSGAELEALNAVSWTRATHVLDSLDVSSHLNRIDLWISSTEVFDPETFLPRVETLLSEDCDARARFEDAMVTLVNQGRLDSVRPSLYCAPPTDHGLVPDFHIHSGQVPRTAFPRLDRAGALQV
ncbi:hypothetical protein PsYK624_059670 [Phanerochaete sordida]|uniref:F-box domain-containing protein n=1 Tax=Phanerochaete sordida TaxID=48140 RepID=A0A9P3G5Y7_9APHY|nr:hypothetical protein PsYK624_059670 [Phanerochaete sordida]